MEEIYIDPFGDVTSDLVVAGCGGKAGVSLLMANPGAAKGGQDHPHKLEQLLREVHILPDEQLLLLALHRVEGKVVCLLNARPVSITDVELYACKLYCLLAHTHASRCYSQQPRADVPHCHPTTMLHHDRKLPEAFTSLFSTEGMGANVFQQVVKAFEEECQEESTVRLDSTSGPPTNKRARHSGKSTSSGHGRLSLPPVVLLPKEVYGPFP